MVTTGSTSSPRSARSGRRRSPGTGIPCRRGAPGGGPAPRGAGQRRLGPRPPQVASVAGLLLQGAVGVEHGLAAHQGHPGLAAHGPALVGRETRDAEVLAALDRPLALGVPDREIRVRADADRALARVETEDAGRILRHDAGHPGDREAPLDDALAVDEWRHRLERWRAEGNGLPLGVDEDVLPPGLLRGRHARRMIARDRGDEPELRARPERLAVRPGGGPERRGAPWRGGPTAPLPVRQEEGAGARPRPRPPPPRPGP